ncbi:MAG: SDR family oxidoreductase [Bacteroidales bacterium]|jgi:3-oxoacyl-[acyl-carrier protein] reductase|nr:SDR family oxidoreductase [Bacteroidales bacterium]
MNLNLKDNIALITASSSGIGYAIGKAFLDEGANLILNGRNSEKLKRVVETLKVEYQNRNILGFSGDLSIKRNVHDLKIFLQENNIPQIDHLILNLGTGKKNGTDLDVNEWNRSFDINLFGAVTVLNELMEIVTSSIIFISSIAGIRVINAPYAYSASKLAILSLAKRLAVDCAPKGLRVNTVIPGNIYFEGGRWSEIIAEDPNVIENYIKKETPLGRFGKPEEIANTVVFLCSKKSSYTTGASIIIDGGQSKEIR